MIYIVFCLSIFDKKTLYLYKIVGKIWSSTTNTSTKIMSFKLFDLLRNIRFNNLYFITVTSYWRGRRWSMFNTTLCLHISCWVTALDILLPEGSKITGVELNPLKLLQIPEIAQRYHTQPSGRQCFQVCHLIFQCFGTFFSWIVTWKTCQMYYRPEM